MKMMNRETSLPFKFALFSPIAKIKKVILTSIFWQQQSDFFFYVLQLRIFSSFFVIITLNLWNFFNINCELTTLTKSFVDFNP